MPPEHVVEVQQVRGRDSPKSSVIVQPRQCRLGVPCLLEVLVRSKVACRLRPQKKEFGRLGVVQNACSAHRASHLAPLGPLGNPIGLFGVVRSICNPVVWGLPGPLLGDSWGPVGGPPGRLLGVSWTALGRVRLLGDLLEASWGLVGGLLGASRSPVWASWGRCCAVWSLRRPSWGPLEAALGLSWGTLGLSWGPSWGVLGASGNEHSLRVSTRLVYMFSNRALHEGFYPGPLPSFRGYVFCPSAHLPAHARVPAPGGALRPVEFVR